MSNPVDERFTVPLYSLAEAAHHLGISPSTFRSWAQGYERRSAGRKPVSGEQIITTLPDDAGARVPFIGLAEAHVLAGIRRQVHVPLQRIRPALRILQEQLGIAHVLASRSLYTDGAEILYDYVESQGDTPEARSARQLVVVRNGQQVFNDIVDSYLSRVEFAPDGWAERVHLPRYGDADVVVDPKRSFGRPIFAKSAVRLDTVISAFKAGLDLDALSEEYGVPQAEILSVLRSHTEQAA